MTLNADFLQYALYIAFLGLGWYLRHVGLLAPTPNANPSNTPNTTPILPLPNGLAGVVNSALADLQNALAVYKQLHATLGQTPAPQAVPVQPQPPK